MSRFFEIETKGKHWLHRVDDVDTHSHGGDPDEGRVIYSKSDKRIYLGNTLTWNLVTTPYDVIGQNIKVLMGKFPLPTGWNLDTTYNDISILLSNDESDVDTTGGSWTITGINLGGGHAHGGTTGYGNSQLLIGYSEPYAVTQKLNHRHSISTETGHFHFFDGAWRWPHVFYCVAEYV